jgi:hypothetical protein
MGNAHSRVESGSDVYDLNRNDGVWGVLYISKSDESLLSLLSSSYEPVTSYLKREVTHSPLKLSGTDDGCDTPMSVPKLPQKTAQATLIG